MFRPTFSQTFIRPTFAGRFEGALKYSMRYTRSHDRYLFEHIFISNQKHGQNVRWVKTS